MRILYFNYMYDLYGSSLGSTIKAKELYGALANHGHEVSIIWRKARQARPSNGSMKSRVRGFLKRRLARYFHETNQLLANFRYLREERRLLNTLRPDVLITRLDMYVLSGLLLAKMRGLPWILEADCPDVYEKKKFYSQYFRFPFLAELLERINVRFSDHIFVVSHQAKSYFMKRGAPAEKITVIPNGANPEKFAPRPRDSEIANQYGLNHRLVIGFIGSFHYWHGVENLIAIVNEISRLRDDVAFLFVGDGGPLRVQLEKLISSDHLEGRVHLTGLVDHADIPRYLSVMDIVLAPYPQLDFFYYSPVKLFEYLCLGKPVVTTAIGQIAEVGQDGVNGFLCAPGDRDEMIRKIAILVQQPELRKAMGEKARQTILETYTWEKHAEKLSRICFNAYLHRNRNAKEKARS